MTRKTLVIAAAVICSLSVADLSSNGAWAFAGTWRLNLEKSNSTSGAKKIEFVQHSNDGLTAKIADLNAIREAKFDGKDYPATAPPFHPDILWPCGESTDAPSRCHRS